VLLVAAPIAAAAAAAKKDPKRKPTGLTGTVLRLGDANFDRETAPGSLPLLFSVGAPWCPHCVALGPTLDALARALAEPAASAAAAGGGGDEGEDDEDEDKPAMAAPAPGEGVRVGKVDGPSNRVLMMRLGVAAFPSLFLVRDGRAWRYQGRGPRTAEALSEFALQGYRTAEPIPAHKSPVSPVGRLVGRAVALPARAGEALSALRSEGWSELQLIAAGMAVPVVLGGAIICALDAVHTRRARAAAAAAWQHEHGE
jgi:thiol-disulfide isomerase/thioredoxin